MRIGELKCQNENYEDKQNKLEAKIQHLEAENEQLKDLLGKCGFMHASSVSSGTTFLNLQLV